jgi:hypothetical protein
MYNFNVWLELLLHPAEEHLLRGIHFEGAVGSCDMDLAPRKTAKTVIIAGAKLRPDRNTLSASAHQHC